MKSSLPVGSIELNGCAGDLTGSACGGSEGLCAQESLVHASCHFEYALQGIFRITEQSFKASGSLSNGFPSPKTAEIRFTSLACRLI